MTIARVIPSPDEIYDPREYFEIVTGTATYRVASGVRDIAIGGLVYTAIAMARGAIGANAAGTAKELELTLPVDHPLVTRYLQQGVPQHRITVTAWSKDIGTGVIKRIWVGNVTSMSVDEEGTEATFRVPSRAGEALLRMLPNVTAGRLCPHVLYDRVCGVDPSGSGPTGIPHKVTTTVLAVDGRKVRVDLATIPAADPLRAKWCALGKLTHVASGEPMTIREQIDLSPGTSTVADLDLQMQMPGLKIGDSVEVQAGCDWFIQTCDLKFDNLSSHGGYTYLPPKNPHVPGATVEEP